MAGRLLLFVSATTCASHSTIYSDSSTLLVHLTDVHVDPLYVPGSIAGDGCYCETHESCPRFPVSCTASSDPATAAGPFGNSDNNCATPPALWSSAMSFLESEVPAADASFVFITGDFGEAGLSTACGPPPAPTARQSILDVISFGMASARSTFPRARVFGVFGNHDTAPGDVFSSSIEMAWLYGPLGSPDGAFGKDLANDTAALATLSGFGWYTTKLTDQTSLIALNTNYWTSLNPANTGNESDAGKLGEAQFEFVSSTLAAIARANRSAVVIGHIPPSAAWLPKLYTRYRAILTQFPVVLAQYFGHEHLDEFVLVRACTPAPPPSNPYSGPWTETTGISWCSGVNLPVGDVWGQGTVPGSPHCPYVPASNGTAEGRISLCEGVCGNLSDCQGFTWYPSDGVNGACCFRINCDEKPPSPNSTAECFEKAASRECEDPQAPLHVLYVTPSLTEGYPASNPGLRVFSVDAATLEPRDVFTYWMNITLANAVSAPDWSLEYSARNLYRLPDVSAQSWADLVERMRVNGSAEFDAFRRATIKQYHSLGPCDWACKADTLSALNGTSE